MAIPAWLIKAKAAAKVAGMLIGAKLRSNFRKWNRGNYGKRDDDKAQK